jgi:hypothetical protein
MGAAHGARQGSDSSMRHGHGPAPGSRPNGRFGPDEDQCYRQAVLTLLLDLHPSQLSAQELDRELAQEGQFAEIDTVRRAVDFLIRVGLLRREGTLVLPTRCSGLRGSGAVTGRSVRWLSNS